MVILCIFAHEKYRIGSCQRGLSAICRAYLKSIHPKINHLKPYVLMKRLSLFCVAVLCVLTAAAQWSKDPANNLKITPPDVPDVYDEMFEMSADGSVYWCYYTPGEMYLQIFDKDGNAKFKDNGFFITDEPRRTFTMVNDLFHVDRDGNAICVVSDLRNSFYDGGNEHDLSFTAYKISPDGKMLWGNDGISLTGDKAYDLVANMNIIQLEDGSYVFSWNYTAIPDGAMRINIMRLSADGKMLWENPVELADDNNHYYYCWLANAGANEFIMLYAYGANQTLTAQKYDFEGNAVWPAPLKVYDQGSYPSGVPLHAFVKFTGDGKGGAFVGWYDFRGGEKLPLSYVSHITSEGTFGYESGEDGSGLSFPENKSCYQLDMAYDGEQDVLYTVHLETDPNKYYDNLVLQKLNAKGEQLWGDEGIALTELAGDESYGQHSIRTCVDGDVVVFYMKLLGLSAASDVDVYATRVDGKTGEKKWTTKLTTMPDFKSSLTSLPLYNDTYYVTKWVKGMDSPESQADFYMQPVNINGALSTNAADVPSAVPAVVADDSFTAVVDGNEVMFNIDAASAQSATLSIYAVTGQMLESVDVELTAGENSVTVGNSFSTGVYMSVITTESESKVVKFAVK